MFFYRGQVFLFAFGIVQELDRDLPAGDGEGHAQLRRHDEASGRSPQLPNPDSEIVNIYFFIYFLIISFYSNFLFFF